jgi:hypothetical protein
MFLLENKQIVRMLAKIKSLEVKLNLQSPQVVDQQPLEQVKASRVKKHQHQKKLTKEALNQLELSDNPPLEVASMDKLLLQEEQQLQDLW